MNIRSLSDKINRISYNPKYSKWVLIILLIIVSFVYNYDEILFFRPQGLHQWRQCDCLSITMNYYQEGINFFQPSVHNLGNDGTGKTVSDFPIIYYFVANLWKLFGHHEFIFRLVNLIITFLGLFALFKLAEDILKDSIWAISLVLLLFTSPMLVYYANNFLANVPAFSFALIAWYFFWKFYKSEKNRFLSISMLFFLLGGLLKVASAISFVAILIIFLVELFNIYKFKNGSKIFTHPKKQLITFLVVIIGIISWYYYANYYNQLHIGGFFLVGILPIWELSYEEIKFVFIQIKEIWFWQYFREGTQITFFILLLLIYVFYKKINKFLMMLTILLPIGFVIYITLFFGALKNHDYYMINLLILMVAICLTFLYSLKKIHNNIFCSVILRVVVIAFIIHNIDFSRRRIDQRYGSWMNKTHLEYTKAFETITPYIRSLGIERTDKVISIPDESINISLYLMDQKGWTNFGVTLDSISITQKINAGAKYLFINDSALYDKPFIHPFIKKKIGTYENIDIYDLYHL